MKTAVVVFPGSNCDRDIAVALEQVTGAKPVMVWHRDTALPDDLALVAVPGGFSYGDYLRSGAIAAGAAGVDPKQVVLHQTWLGGGFGRRLRVGRQRYRR